MDAKRVVYGMLMTSEPQKARLLEYLVDHFGEWIPRVRLVSVLYGSRDDGGPLAADNVVATRLSSLRKKLAPVGLEIEGRSWRGSRLKWATDAAEHAA